MTIAPGSRGPERLNADERRQQLFDVARQLVVEFGVASVTIGSVAERAEVTRALVYKHFQNRDDLLVQLYRREAKRLDKQIRRIVEAAPPGLEAKVRSFIVAAVDAIDEHAPFFAPLRDTRTDPTARRDKRDWDWRSVTYFAELASAEYGIAPSTARTATAVLLAGLPTLLARASNHVDERVELEAIYVDTFLGALTRIAATSGASTMGNDSSENDASDNTS